MELEDSPSLPHSPLSTPPDQNLKILLTHPIVIPHSEKTPNWIFIVPAVLVTISLTVFLIIKLLL